MNFFGSLDTSNAGFSATGAASDWYFELALFLTGLPPVDAEALSEEGWRRLGFACRREVASVAQQQADDRESREACGVAASLCDRASRGDEPSPAEWSAARSSANAAYARRHDKALAAYEADSRYRLYARSNLIEWAKIAAQPVHAAAVACDVKFSRSVRDAVSLAIRDSESLESVQDEIVALVSAALTDTAALSP